MVVSLLSIPWAYQVWERTPEVRHLPEMDKFNVMVVFFVAVMFFLALVGLWVFHLYLTANNKSTLEMGRAPRFKNETGAPNSGTSPYDMGYKRNCLQVYGTGPLVLCPVYTSQGNGVLFARHAHSTSADMRRLLGSTGTCSDEEEVIYNADVPLQLDAVAIV